MHNRDMLWITADGRELKITEITSSHLTNILKHINNNIISFNQKFGEKRIENAKTNIRQEIRFRKLNRISIINQEGDLF